MLLQQLQLKNYKQYKDLDIEFKEGLMAIIGKNGSGKSTIFDAIIFSLFGKDDDKKETIKSTFAGDKENVEVTLIFELNFDTYKVIRELRGKNNTSFAHLYKNNELIATGNNPVNTTFQKLFNLDKKSFKNTVYAAQKQLDELSNSSMEDRRKMIRHILGLNRLDIYQKNINDDKLNTEKEIKFNENNLISSEELEVLNQNMFKINELIKEQNQAIQLDRQKIIEIDKQYKEKKDLFEKEEIKYNKKVEIDKKVIQYKNGVKNLEDNKTKNLLEIRELAEKKNYWLENTDFIKEYEKKNEDFKISLEFQKQYHAKVKLEIEQETINKQREKHHLDRTFLMQEISSKGEIEKKIQELKLCIEQKQLEIDDQDIKIKDLENKISENTGKIKDIGQKLERIQKLGKRTVCPTCLQVLNEAYDITINVLEKEKADLIAENKVYDLPLIQLKKERESKILLLKDTAQQINEKEASLKIIIEKEKTITTIDNEILKFNDKALSIHNQIEELGDIRFDEQEFEILKSELQQSEKKYNHYLTEKGLIEKIPSLHQEIKHIEQRISNGLKLIADTDLELKKLNFEELIFSQLKQEKEHLDMILKQTHSDVHHKELQLKEEEKKLSICRSQLDNHKNFELKIKTLEGQLLDLKKLMSLVIEFKTHILEQVSPKISYEASELFSKITKGRYENIMVDSNFDFYITDNGVQYPIDRFSGGEIDLANLCLRIALSKAIEDINHTQSFNFLAFDEIFGSQDIERTNEIINALQHIQGKFNQIFIISHFESLNDVFSNTLHVKETNNGSIAEWI